MGKVLVLTHEGELAAAVEALKMHPAAIGNAACSRSGATQCSSESTIKRLQQKVAIGNGIFHHQSMLVTVDFADATNKYLAEFQLLHARKNGTRQNCGLKWLRFEYTSLKLPQDGGSFNLRRERHYAPYVFTRERPLEHLL